MTTTQSLIKQIIVKKENTDRAQKTPDGPPKLEAKYYQQYKPYFDFVCLANFGQPSLICFNLDISKLVRSNFKQK